MSGSTFSESPDPYVRGVTQSELVLPGWLGSTFSESPDPYVRGVTQSEGVRPGFHAGRGVGACVQSEVVAVAGTKLEARQGLLGASRGF